MMELKEDFLKDIIIFILYKLHERIVFMILYTCGCSFTYGDELIDKQTAWPYLLKKMLNFDEIINTAICSASNDYIQRNIINFILQNIDKINDLFLVIGWTSDIRFEGYIDYPIQTYVQLKLDRYVQYNHMSKCNIYSRDELKNIISDVIQQNYNKISNNFLMCFKSNIYFNYYNKLKQILLTHYFLKSFNIKHLFFNSLIESVETTNQKYGKNLIIRQSIQKIFHDYLFEKNKKTNQMMLLLKEIQLIEKEISKDFYILNPSMEEYTKNYPIGINKHPLEEGHEVWAKFLYKYIKEKNII